MMSYKKPTFWIMIVAIVLCIAEAVGCSMNPKTEKVQSENYGITFQAIQADCEGIDYDYLCGTLNENYPYICVNWTNHTDDTLCFGNEFIIYKGDKIYEPEEEIYFDALLYGVKPGMSKSENYNLSSYKLTGGEYRLEKTFYLESAPDQTYRVYIEFSVEKDISGKPGEPSWPALEDIKENYSAKQAAADGCVVFVDGSTLFAGEKIWLDFVDDTAAGQPAVVRIYQSYESGFYCVKELRYDKEKYLLQYYDWTGDTHDEFFAQQEYRYLIHSPHSVNGSESDNYLLADNKEVTAEGYFNALASSIIRPEYDIYNHCHWIYSRYR